MAKVIEYTQYNVSLVSSSISKVVVQATITDGDTPTDPSTAGTIITIDSNTYDSSQYTFNFINSISDITISGLNLSSGNHTITITTGTTTDSLSFSILSSSMTIKPLTITTLSSQIT